MLLKDSAPQSGCTEQSVEESARYKNLRNDADADLEAHVEAILINAELYSEMGFDMHLCHGINPDGSCTCRWGVGCGNDTGKHPRRKNWQKLATRDVSKLRDWLKVRPTSNLGIRTGNRLVVIDIDPKHGGFETLAKLEAEYGPLPRKHVVRTGSGGLHIYLAVSAVDACKIGSFSGSEGQGLGCGVDVKARGGQVIAAPSRHHSGNSYEWLTLSPEPLSELPVYWTARLIELSPPPARTSRPRRAIRRRQRQTRQQPKQQTRQLRDNVAGAVCNIVGCDPTDDVVSRVGYCLIRCQVTGRKMTNDAIYRLACGLRNIPELADKSAADLEPLIKFWFNVGKGNMSKAGWGTVWNRWIYTWGHMSETQVGPAWDAAHELDTPDFRRAAEKSEHDGLYILRAVCTHIQEHARDGRWFLTVRTAADVLASFDIVVTPMTTNRWINALVAEGFLVRNSYRDATCPATNWYETAAARCVEHGQQQQAGHQMPPAIAARLSTPANLIAPRNRPTAEQTLSPLANTLAHAGRDELLSTDFASVRTKQLHAVQRN